MNKRNEFKRRTDRKKVKERQVIRKMPKENER